LIKIKEEKMVNAKILVLGKTARVRKLKIKEPKKEE
jgi:hypothetical protein